VWIGRSSSGIERRSALAWVQKHCSGSPITIVDDGYEQAMSQEQLRKMKMPQVDVALLWAFQTSDFSDAFPDFT